MATVKGKEEHETLKQTALDYKVNDPFVFLFKNINSHGTMNSN